MKNVLKFHVDSQKAYAIDEFNNINEKNTLKRIIQRKKKIMKIKKKIRLKIN